MRSSKGLDDHNILPAEGAPDDSSAAVLADNSAAVVVGPGDNSGVVEHFCCWKQLQLLQWLLQPTLLQMRRCGRFLLVLLGLVMSLPMQA